MNSVQTWAARSYAKINLGLYILGNREDGYHDIETGFCFIDWSDRFRIAYSGETKLELSDDSIPVDRSNLILRALDLIRKETGLKSHYHIEVRKSIPAGAGLGGGSSNAALTLRMIDKIEGLKLGDDELCRMAARLGSDVPLFIRHQTAIGSGTGSTLRPVSLQPETWIVTVWPGFACSTAGVYTQVQRGITHEVDLEKLLTEQEYAEWPFLLQNDLEPVVMLEYPQIGHLKDNFYSAGAVYASISGSGSSVFGLFEQEFVAKAAYGELIELGYRVNITSPRFKPDTGIYLEV